MQNHLNFSANMNKTNTYCFQTILVDVISAGLASKIFVSFGERSFNFTYTSNYDMSKDECRLALLQFLQTCKDAYELTPDEFYTHHSHGLLYHLGIARFLPTVISHDQLERLRKELVAKVGAWLQPNYKFASKHNELAILRALNGEGQK